MVTTGRSEFSAALNQVAHERGLDPFEVLDTIKAAILAAYRRDYEQEELEEIEAQVDAENGEVKLIKEGKDITPPGFGRIAAQTAKQVLLQRIREAEKTAILTDYSKKIGTVVTGMVQRQQGPAYIIDIGRAEAVMPPREQVKSEYYYLNQRLKFYISEIRERDKRSEIIVSRTHPDLVPGLFAQEVPEISTGSVVVKAVAREAGFRTKIAVVSTQLGVDPVGSCVGQRGNRIQTVINELSGEKIDVIAWNDDPVKFIMAALQPAKNVRIEITQPDAEGNKHAKAFVQDDELSLAIGSKGQNVRLASKLTDYQIEIVGKEGQLTRPAQGAIPEDLRLPEIEEKRPDFAQATTGKEAESVKGEEAAETKPAEATLEPATEEKAVEAGEASAGTPMEKAAEEVQKELEAPAKEPKTEAVAIADESNVKEANPAKEAKLETDEPEKPAAATEQPKEEEPAA